MEELRFSDYCANCRKSLAEVEKLLFVEKEVGRCFCCEQCIQDYFQPTVQFMQEQLAKLRSDADVDSGDGDRHQQLRDLTLEEPDEVWVEQADNGERLFTFISHFRKGEERLSFVVISLAIDGVPSFIFLSFATRDEDLVDEYRRGIDLRVADAAAVEEPSLRAVDLASKPEETATAQDEPSSPGVSLLERLHAEARQSGDIGREEFVLFDGFVEPTLDDPDEIWSYTDDDGKQWCMFIARHVFAKSSQEDIDEDEAEYDEFAMVVVCEPGRAQADHGKNTLTAYEIVFAFPTIDAGLIQLFRKGVNVWNPLGQEALRMWRAGGRAA